MKPTNTQAPAFIARREAFTTGNETLYGNNHGDWYVVYSYGPHWPLAACHKPTGAWFVNESKTSNTTTRHLGLVRRALHGVSTPCLPQGTTCDMLTRMLRDNTPATAFA